MKLKLDLSSITTTADLKGATGFHTSKVAAKSDLTNLKCEINKLDRDKLKTVPADLSKLGNVINNNVVKKTVYDKLVAKVDAIDTKAWDSDKQNLEKKIEDFGKKVPHFIGLVEKTNYNRKIIERENQTANSSVLVSKLQS